MVEIFKDFFGSKELLASLMSFLTIVLTAGVGVFKTFKFVEEGQLGIRLTFGKAARYWWGAKKGKVKIIKPGFIVLIPFAQNLRRRHVKTQTLRFDKQKITLKNGMSFNFQSSTLFKVVDIYKALFEVDGLNKVIEEFVLGKINAIASASQTYTELLDAGEVSKKILEGLQSQSEDWGVEFKEFNITTLAPSNAETSNLILLDKRIDTAVKSLKKHFPGDLPRSSNLMAAVIGVPVAVSVVDEKEKSLKKNRNRELLSFKEEEE